MHDHYSLVHNIYHDSLFYTKGSEYENWQFQSLVSLLNIKPCGSGTILDLGGGTGRLAELLTEHLGSGINVVCVDKSKFMLEQANKIRGVTTINADAVDFIGSIGYSEFDAVICKELIHYIKKQNALDELFKGIARSLKPNGAYIICTRPHDDIDYPFFADAIARWQANQPPYTLYVEALQKAGFNSIEVIHANYPITIPLESWLDFIRQRIWSTFSKAQYSDIELQRGIEEIRERYRSNGTLINFNDKLIFIRATRF